MRKPRRVLRWGLNQLGLHRHRQDLGILELGFVLVWEGIGRKRDFGVWVWVEKKRERKWRKVESWVLGVKLCVLVVVVAAAVDLLLRRKRRSWQAESP